MMGISQLPPSDLLVILDVTRRITDQRLGQPLRNYVTTTIFGFIPTERCLVVLFADDRSPAIIFAGDHQGQSLPTDPDQLSRSVLAQTKKALAPLWLDERFLSRLRLFKPCSRHTYAFAQYCRRNGRC